MGAAKGCVAAKPEEYPRWETDLQTHNWSVVNFTFPYELFDFWLVLNYTSSIRTKVIGEFDYHAFKHAANDHNHATHNNLAFGAE